MSGIFSAGERIRAERQLDAVLARHTDLRPNGFTTEFVENYHWQDYYGGREGHLQGFHWARHFLALGCHRLSSARSRKSTSSHRLKDLAGDAAEETINRRIDVQHGVLIAAAFSLSIDVEREFSGPGAILAVRATWRSSR